MGNPDARDLVSSEQLNSVEPVEPTEVWKFEELPESLRAEKKKRDLDKALLRWRTRHDFAARCVNPTSVFKGVGLY